MRGIHPAGQVLAHHAQEIVVLQREPEHVQLEIAADAAAALREHTRAVQRG